MSRVYAAIPLLLCAAYSADAVAQPAPPIAWQRTLDGGGTDGATSVDGDGLGHIYVGGVTDGGLGGPGLGSHDGFFAKYDVAGSLLWTRQVGTSADDHVSGIRADALGNVFIAGSTSGGLDGSPLGGGDAFVAKYDAAGNQSWVRQFGTATSDSALGLADDGSGNVYVAGYLNQDSNFPYPTDAFVRKYDGNGLLVWSRTIATSEDDKAFNVAADGLGNFYIAGDTTGSVQGMSAGSYDAWLAKYDADGNELWRRQRGSTSADFVRDVAADGLGNIYLTGYSAGNLGSPPVGIYDAFVMKYDAAGNHVWTRQLGTTLEDESWGATTDGLGNVIITGTTNGALSGMNAGVSDAFVTMYDAAGNLLWTRQFGAANDDGGNGVWADGFGGVYAAGTTNAMGRTPSAGDALLVKLAPVPEPSAVLLLGACAAALIVGRIGSR
jgi:hypothetical protein